MPNPYTKSIKSYLQADRIAPFIAPNRNDTDYDCAMRADAFTRLSECDKRAIRTHWAAVEEREQPTYDAETRARWAREDAGKTLMEILMRPNA